MVLKFAAASLAIFMSSAVFSAVTLTVPDEIKVLAVNDKEVFGNLLRSKDQFKVDAGVNTLQVRYQGYYQHADNSHDVLKSGVVSLQTPALQDGVSYKLALIDAPKDFDQAERYKDQPIIGLYDQNNKLIVQQAGAKNQKSWLANAFSDSSAVDLSTAKAVPAEQPAPVYYVQAESGAKRVDIKSAQDQQLIQAWQNATKVERQKFMSWLAEQSN